MLSVLGPSPHPLAPIPTIHLLRQIHSLVDPHVAYTPRSDHSARRARRAAVAPPSALRTPTDPLDGTIADYQAGRRRGDWTAAEVTARALDRCRTEGMRWRAIDALSDTALADARAADARLRAGQLRGPLDGVPVFAKAIYDMNGLPTTGSNAEWARLFPDPVRRDALEVARLRAAGAIVLGKTAADDFAYHGNGTSSHTGQVLNPHDPTGTRTPGGSSAGSAVAVADGMAFAALGTDDGGSNRIPAQFTGVVGMKPTFGLVPRTGVIPTWPYLDTHGPLARIGRRRGAPARGDRRSRRVGPARAHRRVECARRSPRSATTHSTASGSASSRRTCRAAQMTAEALAVWDRAVGDLRAAGAIVEAFAPPVTASDLSRRLRRRREGARRRRRRSRLAGAHRQRAAPLLRRSHGGRARCRAPGLPGVPRLLRRAARNVRGMRAAARPADDGRSGGRSFARSRADVVGRSAMRCAQRMSTAMVYPTMPFNAPRVVDHWPNIRNDARLRQLARPAGSVGPGRPRRGRNAGAQHLLSSDCRARTRACSRCAHAYERHSRRFVPPSRA